MPDVSDITSTAVQLARRKGKVTGRAAEKPEEDGGGWSGTDGAAVRGGGHRETGRRLPREKAAGLGKKAKGKVAEARRKPSATSPMKSSARNSEALAGSSTKTGRDDEEEATEAHGSGRRMPIQQSVDVAVPIKRPTTSGPDSKTGRIHAPGRQRPADRRLHRPLLNQGLGHHQGVRGRNRRAAAGRADRMAHRGGADAQRRRHLPRTGAAADRGSR